MGDYNSSLFVRYFCSDLIWHNGCLKFCLFRIRLILVLVCVCWIPLVGAVFIQVLVHVHPPSTWTSDCKLLRWYEHKIALVQWSGTSNGVTYRISLCLYATICCFICVWFACIVYQGGRLRDALQPTNCAIQRLYLAPNSSSIFQWLVKPERTTSTLYLLDGKVNVRLHGFSSIRQSHLQAQFLPSVT